MPRTPSDLGNQGLSQSRIARLPRRDNEDFLLNYVKEQRHLRGYYASCGPNVMLSIGPPSSTVSQTTPSQNSARPHNAVFGTPLLKPRVTHAITRIPRRKVGPVKPPSDANPSKSKPGAGVDRQDKDALPVHSSGKGPRLEEQDDGRRDSDSWVERLAIRRERRRQRKKIKEPPKPSRSASDSNSDSEDASAQKAKKGKKTSNRTRLPPGFALMHGFSATNVGKNRLTLEPSVSKTVGVFSRGRASDALLPGRPGKSSGANGQFSENKFLSKTRSRSPSPPRKMRAKRKGNTSSKPQSDDDDESHILLHKMRAKRREQAKLPKDKSFAKRTAPRSETLDNESSVASEDNSDNDLRERAESVVWDIERSSGKLASSAPSYSQVAESTNPTVVLQLPESLRKPAIDPPLDADSITPRVVAPSISPSESASQLPRSTGTRPGRREDAPFVSRYFANAVDTHDLESPPSHEMHPQSHNTTKGFLQDAVVDLRSGPPSNIEPSPNPRLLAPPYSVEDASDLMSCLQDRDYFPPSLEGRPADFCRTVIHRTPRIVESCLPADQIEDDWRPSDMSFLSGKEHPLNENPYLLDPDCDTPVDDGFIPNFYPDCEDGGLGIAEWNDDQLAPRYTDWGGACESEVEFCDETMAVTPRACCFGDAAETFMLSQDCAGGWDSASGFGTTDSDLVEDLESDLGQLQFVEGRALLHGLHQAQEPTQFRPRSSAKIAPSPAEMDVVRQLQGGHWHPQRL